MTAGLLQRLIEAGHTSVAELADLLCIEPHSVYPYLAHRDMRVSQLRTLIRGAKSVAVREAVLCSLFAGTEVVALDPADLDADGDGVIDARDAMHAAIEAMD